MIHIDIEKYRARIAGILRFLAFFVAALVLSPAYAAVDYQLIDLGADVSPTDINYYGSIVGRRTTGTGNVGFVISGGTLQDIPGTTSANAINDSGLVTGTTSTGAFLLDVLNGGLKTWSGYGGYGINASGQISGYKQLNNPYQSSPLPLDPAVYTPNRWTNLGVATVYPRGTVQGAYADLYVLNGINNSGYAVGKRSRSGLVGSSVILTEPAFDQVFYLPIPNGGYAAAINDTDLVVGATGDSKAYLYDYDNKTIVYLGTLNDNTGLTSSAADINNYNQVVGTSWLATVYTSLNDPTQHHAFLWDETNGMSDLNDALPAGSGWTLTAATAINDNGDIVGIGLLDGQVHGFLLSTSASSSAPVSAPTLTSTQTTTTGNGNGKGKGRK
jgi:probable HAF family extracellular repeat protein